MVKINFFIYKILYIYIYIYIYDCYVFFLRQILTIMGYNIFWRRKIKLYHDKHECLNSNLPLKITPL
jgi:hypothetical protein